MRKTILIAVLSLMLVCSACSTRGNISGTYDQESKTITFNGRGEIDRSAAHTDDTPYIHIKLDSGITAVAADTFSAESNEMNKDIQTVKFSDSITSIGDRAFLGCVKLRDLSLPEHLNELGESAFEGCNSIRVPKFPNNLATIGARVFAECKEITHIDLGAETLSIGKEAFKGCKSMTYAKLPKKLSEIGEGAFEDCTRLSIVNIPDSVKIGDAAFYNCKKLIGVFIPDTVEQIGEKAFGYYLENGTERKLRDFIIKGKKNSAAERYAQKNGFTFVENKTADFDVDLTAKTVSYKELPSFGYMDAFDTLNSRLETYVDNGGKENYNPLDDEYFVDVDDWGEADMFYDEYRKYLENDSIDVEKCSAQLTEAVKSQYRKVGDYIISDFEDGVCINKFLFSRKKFPKDEKNYGRTPITISIPSEIDGKKVLKLGEYIKNEDDYYESYGFLTTIPDDYEITLKIPSSVTDITANALDSIDLYHEDDFFYSNGYIIDIDVAEDNPLYCSENGVMYSKDKRWLLFFRPDPYDDENGGKRQTFTVPESVEYIAVTNLCETRIDPEYTLVLGKNIKKIYGYLSTGECGTYSCDIKTEKGSYAEKWVKKQMSY